MSTGIEPGPRQQTILRLDANVIAGLKASVFGWQSHINAMLEWEKAVLLNINMRQYYRILKLGFRNSPIYSNFCSFS